MSAAQATIQHAEDPVPRDPARGRLLGLVRRLIDFGRDLMTAMQGRETPDAPPVAITRRFGSLNVALIIARITRGLMIAAALEQRLLRPAPPMAPRPPPAGPRPDRKPNPRPERQSRPPSPDPDAELLGALPSAREIAARIRNRRTGAVIVEICRDLGISMRHPLWPEIRDAIRYHGGNLGIMLRNVIRPYNEAVEQALPPEDIPNFDGMMAILERPP